MMHKTNTYETANSPCKVYCDNTVTIAGHVFEKDQIGNFLFAYCAAKAFTLGITKYGAARAHPSGKDDPDDIAAIEAGYAFGRNPSKGFKATIESFDIPAMQKETAKRAWPSTETATGIIHPTFGGKKK
jgi:hypothetical protein